MVAVWLNKGNKRSVCSTHTLKDALTDSGRHEHTKNALADTRQGLGTIVL